MPAVRNDVELDLGPGLLQPPRGDRRRAAVVAALDDDAWNARQLRGLAQQLTFFEPTVVRHIMILDPGDGDRHVGAGEMLDRFGAGEEGDDVAFPLAPRLRGLELHA